MVNLLGKERFSWLASVAVYRQPRTRKRGKDKKAGNMALPQELTVGKLVSLNEQPGNVRPREHNRFVYYIFYFIYMSAVCVYVVQSYKCLDVCACAHICKGQRKTLGGIFFYCSQLYCLETGSLMEPDAHNFG